MNFYISGFYNSNNVLFENLIACTGEPKTDLIKYDYVNLDPDFIMGEQSDITITHIELLYFSVWVGGAEINQYPVGDLEAQELVNNYLEDGYDDVKAEPIPPKGTLKWPI
jgi:hypothetical protein